MLSIPIRQAKTNLASCFAQVGLKFMEKKWHKSTRNRIRISWFTRGTPMSQMFQADLDYHHVLANLSEQ
jgi:hypothetical protein